MWLVWISAVKEIKLLRHDAWGVLFWMGIPLCIAAMIHLVFGGRPVRPQARLLVADEDKSVASATLIAGLKRSPVAIENVEPAAGRDRIEHADGSAFLRIPKGFQTAFFTRQPFRFELVTNPRQRILPRIAQENISVALETAFYLQEGGAGAINRAAAPVAGSVGGFRGLAALPPIRLRVENTGEKEEGPNIAILFFPGMLFMALLLTANALAGDIWRERVQGTARRLATTPGTFGAALGGRVIAVALLYGLVACVGVAATRWLGGPQVGRLAPAVAWAALSGTVFFLLLLPLSLRASNERGADVMGNILVFPLSLVGGCFFPFEMMPNWMASIGRVTPNGWAVTQFRAILFGSAEPRVLAIGTACLVCAGAVGFTLAARRMRGAFLA
jgi:ABC-type multidrug transport system permease subunit